MTRTLWDAFGLSFALLFLLNPPAWAGPTAQQMRAILDHWKQATNAEQRSQNVDAALSFLTVKAPRGQEKEYAEVRAKVAGQLGFISRLPFPLSSGYEDQVQKIDKG